MTGVHHYFYNVKLNVALTCRNSFFKHNHFFFVFNHACPLWITQVLQHNCDLTLFCGPIFVMEILWGRQVVFVRLEVTWMGANRRTVKKANNNKTACRFWGQKSIGQGHRNSLPLSRTKTSSLYRWLVIAVMSRITNRLNNGWLKVKRLTVVSKGCGKRKQQSSSALLWRKAKALEA